jgi:hypothetical protein
MLVGCICKTCQDHFLYDKKYSYIRKLCDKCLKENKAENIIRNHNSVVDYSGCNNPNYKGLVTLTCGVCSKNFDVIPAASKVRKTCCYDCYRVWCSRKFSGAGNPKYIDGRRINDYGDEFTKALKEQIRDRDDRVCQNCNMKEDQHKNLTKQSLIVHHIDYNKKNNSEQNLISLCSFCHNRIGNSNKNEFLSIYQQKIIQKYLEVEA